MENIIINNYIEKNKEFKNIELFITKFPSFNLDVETLKSTLKDVLTEKLRLAIDSNKYGTLTTVNIDYDSYVLAQRMSHAKIKISEKQEKILSFMQEVLPIKMSKDSNMSSNELIRGTIYTAISERITHSLMDLQFLTALNDNKPHPVTILETKTKKQNLAGTLIMIKELFPVVYTQIEGSMQDMLFEQMFKEIQSLMKYPTLDIKENILMCDKILAVKLFPLEVEELNNTNQLKIK